MLNKLNKRLWKAYDWIVEDQPLLKYRKTGYNLNFKFIIGLLFSPAMKNSRLSIWQACLQFQIKTSNNIWSCPLITNCQTTSRITTGQQVTGMISTAETTYIPKKIFFSKNFLWLMFLYLSRVYNASWLFDIRYSYVNNGFVLYDHSRGG